MIKVKLATLGLSILGLVATSCASIPRSVPAEWSPKSFFRNAQDALELDYYDLANYYYDVFIIRYPEDESLIISAQYEKAFILYKRGRYNEAKASYQAIIERYETDPESVTFRPRFKKLAEIGLQTIEWKRRVNKKFFWRESWSKWAREEGENLLDPSASPG